MTNTPQTPQSTATLPPPPVGPPSPAPVAGRRNGASIWLGLLVAVLAVPFVVITFVAAIAIVVVSGIASGEITVTERVEVSLAPQNLADLPASIVEEHADVEIDLTRLDVASLDQGEPVDLDIEVEFGRVEIIVPEGLDVAVDASTDLGDVTVFDETDNGFDNRVVQPTDSADVTLNMEVNVGDIDVVRA